MSSELPEYVSETDALVSARRRGHLRRALVNGGFALLVGGAAGYAWVCMRWLHRRLLLVNYNDFGKFYYSSEQWLGGGDMYGPSPATLIPIAPGRQEHFWNMNPPHFQGIMLLLVPFPIDVAYAVWSAVNLLGFVIAVWLIAGEAGYRLSPLTGGAVVVLCLASAPALSVALTGQFTGLLVLLVTSIWRWARRERWVSAGVAIGVLCSMKPFFGPLGLLLLVRERWRASLVAGGAFFGCIVLGGMLIGFREYQEWLGVIREVRWVGAVMNASIYGPIARAWSLDIFAPNDYVMLLGGGLAVVLVVAGVIAMRRTTNPDRAVLIALLTSLLASPLGWIYYVPVVAGPIVSLAVRQDIGPAWVLAIAVFWVPFFLLGPAPSQLFALTAGSIYCWSLLALWGLSIGGAGRVAVDNDVIARPGA